MRKSKLILLILTAALLLSACGAPAATEGNKNDTVAAAEPLSGTENSPSGADLTPSASDMFTRRDLDSSFNRGSCVSITLNGSSISCVSDSVEISDSTAVITSAGSYILSGTLDDGTIIVNAGGSDKVQLVLDGASIHSESSAALYILRAGKVFLTLAPDTVNTLSNGGTFSAIDGNNIDAALFSKQDLSMNGSGSLSVLSPAGHGIVSKDALVITEGTYSITAASHGLSGKDSVRVAGGSITVKAGKDGIHAENGNSETKGFVFISGGTLDMNADGDGISAGAYIRLEDGSFRIVAGGGSAKAEKKSDGEQWGGHMGRPGGGPMGGPMGTPPSTSSSEESAEKSSASTKGLKAGGDIFILGGEFAIDAADDAVHSNASIEVSGGSFEIATGDDGFHADKSLTVSGGNIRITECYEGLEALDIEISGGDIALYASDDGLNAAGGRDSSGFGGPRGNDQFGHRGGGGSSSSSKGSILISGGNLYINASGDGIDANGSLEISGGTTIVVGPTQGDTATLDYDISGVITGGTFIGTGAAGMAQTFSNAEQGVISVRAGNQAANTRLVLTDQAGNVLMEHTPELPYAVVILSTPQLIKGETYILSVGELSGEVTAN